MAKLKVTPMNQKIECLKKFYDEDYCKIMYPNESYENIIKNGTNILAWINSRINLLPIQFSVCNPRSITISLPSDTKPEDIDKYKKSVPPDVELFIQLYEKKSNKNKTVECEKEENPLDDEIVE